MKKSGNAVLNVFCCDTLSIDEAFLALIDEVFDEETLTGLKEYADVLRRIHDRLISEGYIFVDGKFMKKEYNMNQDDRKN